MARTLRVANHRGNKLKMGNLEERVKSLRRELSMGHITAPLL